MEREGAEGAVPHSVCCVTSTPQKPQSRSCSVLHGPRACFMRWLWVEASLVLGCARGERCPWDNTPQRMLRRHLPLLEEKFQHISLRSLCRPLHPEFAALGGSSSVSFGLDLCQQSLPAEVGDASKPVAPSPALSFLFGLQPSPPCLYRVLWDKIPLSLPHSGKAKLSASSWRPLLSQQFASHRSYVRFGIFPPSASHFHLTVFKIVQTHLFPLLSVPDERFPGS